MKEISLNDLDLNFVKAIERKIGGMGGVSVCSACGQCTASCPVRKANDSYNPRKMIRMAILGMKEELVKSPSIWLCSTCYTCQERCPQGVRITEIMTAIKNLAVEEGNCPPDVALQWKLLSDQGRLYPIDDFDNKKRAKSGLPPLMQRIEEIGELMRGLSQDHRG